MEFAGFKSEHLLNKGLYKEKEDRFIIDYHLPSWNKESYTLGEDDLDVIRYLVKALKGRVKPCESVH